VLRDLPVLVVDDNATSRQIVSEMLQNWGARPEAVASAAAGLERLRAAEAAGQPYGVILLDDTLPPAEGTAACN
jgi:CheY-like chemotaxis protein